MALSGCGDNNISLSIDNNTAANFRFTDWAIIEGTKYLGVVNNWENEILIYDLDASQLYSRFYFSKVRQDNSEIAGFVFVNKDSVLVIKQDIPRIYVFNIEGKLKSELVFKSPNWSTVHAVHSGNKPILLNSKIYMPRLPSLEELDSLSYNEYFAIEYIFDLNKKSIEIIKIPYLNKQKQGIRSMLPARVVIGNEIKYFFSNLSKVVSYNLSTGIIHTQGTPLEVDIRRPFKGIFTNYAHHYKHYMENDILEYVDYNQHKGEIILVVKEATNVDEKIPFDYLILVYNKNFEAQNKIKVSGSDFYTNNYFSNEDGFFMQKRNKDNENLVTFKKMD